MSSGKNGYNTNLASEFHVLSQLYRLGFNANLTLGNKKSVDIVVVQSEGHAVTIDVKAVAGRVDWLVGNIPVSPKKNHFVVLLTYDSKISDVNYVPRAWIVPHNVLLPMVKSAKPPSKMKYISRKEVMEQLSDYFNNWLAISNR